MSAEYHDLDEQEAEYLRDLWRDHLRHADGAAADARLAAVGLVAELQGRYGNRVERLVALSALSAVFASAQAELLGELLGARFRWTPSKHRPGDLVALAWETHELRGLAEATGLTQGTLSRKAQAIAMASYIEAHAAEVARHGEYNGWCRVEGMPLKAAECAWCRAAAGAEQ